MAYFTFLSTAWKGLLPQKTKILNLNFPLIGADSCLFFVE